MLLAGSVTGEGGIEGGVCCENNEVYLVPF